LYCRESFPVVLGDSLRHDVGVLNKFYATATSDALLDLVHESSREPLPVAVLLLAKGRASFETSTTSCSRASSLTDSQRVA
jgi:hypothetical protein